VNKPRRFLLDRLSGYADEAAAFVRRRRVARRPFARVHYEDGSSVALEETEEGRALFLAAARLIDISR
jgi:hypothetical protein